MNDQERIEVIDEFLNDRGALIVDRARAAGLGIGIACTVVDKESDGRNIFGADWGTVGADKVPFAGLPVTKARVQALLDHIDSGGQSNGVGLTQLTYPPFLRTAEERGGAHRPKIQLDVGFEIIRDLTSKHAIKNGFAAYNGGEGQGMWGAQAQAYGQDAVSVLSTWRKRLELNV
jgi:hypothetical protein